MESEINSPTLGSTPEGARRLAMIILSCSQWLPFGRHCFTVSCDWGMYGHGGHLPKPQFISTQPCPDRPLRRLRSGHDIVRMDWFKCNCPYPWGMISCPYICSSGHSLIFSQPLSRLQQVFSLRGKLTQD